MNVSTVEEKFVKTILGKLRTEEIGGKIGAMLNAEEEVSAAIIRQLYESNLVAEGDYIEEEFLDLVDYITDRLIEATPRPEPVKVV